MMKFSANLGFLFADRSLPEAIHAAKDAGFDAVECHWPYDTPADAVRDALTLSKIPMLGLNTRRGKDGENGLSALPNRQAEARAAIDEALDYAEQIDAQAIHVMAGFSSGALAARTFVENLEYAVGRTSRTILIEPLNPHDAPGYFLKTTGQAKEIIQSVSAPNLKLMFDCYHVGRTEGDVVGRLKSLLPIIGHIQFASVPDRDTPDQGELDYHDVFEVIEQSDWRTPLGAEYKCRGRTEENLDWMKTFR